MNSTLTTVTARTCVMLDIDSFDWEQSMNDFFYGESGWHSTFIIGALLYIPLTFSIKKIMSFMNPIDSSIIKPILLLWNIWMTIFSFIGAYYTLPRLYDHLAEHNWSLRGQVCDSSCYDYPSALWIFIFNVTKMMEWVDTIFLLIQKKPVIFLHWFHHIVTMLYCWHATIFSVFSDCSGWWFASMNLFVHTIMYAYYGVRSIYSLQNKKFKLFSPLYITILQIVQMMIGVYITLISYVRCEKTRNNNTFGVMFAGAMYLIYFYLFFKLFTQKKKSRSSSLNEKKKIQ